MAIYKVLPHCRVFKPGAYVEDGGDGMVQEIDVMQDGNTLVPMGFKGLMVPFDSVRNDIVRIQKRGLDKKW